MIKPIILAASAAAVVASASPVCADPFTSSLDEAPRGASATVNIRIPFGPRTTATEEPSYGLSFNYGRSYGSPDLDNRVMTRAITLGDLRFNADGLAKAQVASFDLADFGRDTPKDPRMNLFEGPFGWPEYAIIGGAALIVALVAF